MENLVIDSLFNNIYKDKKVLITGHTGFKGSWLCAWLSILGANIVGYSKDMPTNPSHFELLNLNIKSIFGDINDFELLNKVVSEEKPDIVFHLAAQALVLESYKNPLETYKTNVLGTLNLFEMCRKHSIKAIVNITSDKCYENKEWIWGYRENDALGGYDPYSSSKACSEILTSSYRNSFFNLNEYQKTHNTLLASCRAGNVIGGGDWSKDRLIVDLIVSASKEKPAIIRSPRSIRPWQHVLGPLHGYLLLGQKLLECKKEFADAWNFASNHDNIINVENMVKKACLIWCDINYKVEESSKFHEANLLRLDSIKAKEKLKWCVPWDSEMSIQKTIEWYKKFYKENKILTYENINEYMKDLNEI